MFMFLSSVYLMLEIHGRLAFIAFSYNAFKCAFTCFDLIHL